MSQRNPGSTYPGGWAPQSHGQSGGGYTQGGSGYGSRARQVPPQPATDTSYYQQQHGGRGTPQYPHSGPHAGASYVHNSTVTSGVYPVQTATDGYAGGYQSSLYTNGMPQYPPQSQPWPQAHPGPVAPGGQGMVPAHFGAPPVGYSSPPLPPVAPRTNDRAGPSYSSPNTWARPLYPASGSLNGLQVAGGRATGSGAEHSVPCPYNCGTVLTGVHAVGNMTRHLKSQNCIGSGKEKPRYACTVEGCDKRYIRSDGLKVHLRKRHNIAHSDRNGSPGYDEGEYGYS
ncbi:hypothetical protein OPT61_g10211 [Boeremia exigua]|uniref:Uncharacterized protein n=1 Tax=Boeremia exigua TaxID=749465 RepID=A0ACC2HQV5_9PLEO|nr:hypothetical protein OPT61_g10211 [Boeremia exigua]